MTVLAAPKLRAYVLLSGLGLGAAILVRQPELVALSAPFAVAVIVGLARSVDPRIELGLTSSRKRVIEGDRAVLQMTVGASTAVDRLDIRLELPPGLELEGDAPAALVLRAGERRTIEIAVRCVRWGAYPTGALGARAVNRFAMIAFEHRYEAFVDLRVLPRVETVRALVHAAETQVFAGDIRARGKGAGTEFADVRPFRSGDRPRQVNWRVSARREELWVTDRHPEQNTDVVIFLDSFASVGRQGRSTLDVAVRAAATLAISILRRRNRVGVVGFGGSVRWLTPSTGERQLYRVIDMLLGTEIVFNVASKSIDTLPPRTLPPAALVLALTPLIDDRSIRALIDLQSRGFDVAALEISPDPFLDDPGSEQRELALRIWRLGREASRDQLERLGIAVIAWNEDVPLESAASALGTFRRHAPGRRA